MLRLPCKCLSNRLQPVTIPGMSKFSKRHYSSLIGLTLSLFIAACAGRGSGPIVESTQPVASVPLVEVTPLPTSEQPTPDVSPTPAYDPFTDQRPLAETGYLIPPTIQHVTDTTAHLLFELEAPQPGLLFYRSRDGGDLYAFQLSPSLAYHSFLLEDLDPGTTYDLLVRLGGDPPEGRIGASYEVLLEIVGGPGPDELSDVPFMGQLWGPQSFRTPPFGDPVRFAVIGDSGFGEDVTVSLVQHIAAFEPHFMLHTGDVVYKGEENGNAIAAYQAKYYSPFAPVLRQAPLYPAVGNHDVTDNGVKLDGLPFYYRAFPPIVSPANPLPPGSTRQFNAFSLTIGEAQVQFLQIDTQVLFGEQGRAEQQAWLEHRLADPAYAYTIVSMHVPPYTSSRHTTDALAVRGWAQLFEDSRVALVFTGHEHAFEHLQSGPTTYVITGGGSASLYALSSTDPRSQFFASRSHVSLVELFSDRIEIRVVSPGGEVLYSLSLPTPAP